MLMRGKSLVGTNRGPDRRTPALNINSPFVWFPGKEIDSNKIPNFGNIGEDLEYTARGNTAKEAAIFANAPYYRGEPVGAFRTLRGWMSTLDSNGSENIDVINMARFPELDDGSVLVFMRIKPVTNSWDESLLLFGGDVNTIGAIGWFIKINNGLVSVGFRYSEGAGGIVTIALGTSTVDDGEHRFLFHFNKNAGTVKMYDGVTLLGSYDISAAMALWGSIDNQSLVDRKFAITLGDNQVKISGLNYVPGQRSSQEGAINMSASDMRDILTMSTTGNTLQVDSNLPAIAAAFEKIAPGQLPPELKGYVE